MARLAKTAATGGRPVVTATAAQSQSGRRSENQDRILLESHGALILLAVADGIGGLPSGDRAAEAAIDSLRSSFLARGQLTHDWLISAFQTANHAVYDLSNGANPAGTAGTTMVACVSDGSRYLVGNSGDSRCYYVSNYAIYCLTQDHTRVQDLVNRGQMTLADASRSPLRNELTNALGDETNIRVDVAPEAPHFGVIDESCVLLLCSDGLHGWVHERQIFSELRANADLTSGCNRLVSLALMLGSTDNISVVAIEFGDSFRCSAPSFWRRRSSCGRCWFKRTIVEPFRGL